jgi:choline monooxygenase
MLTPTADFYVDPARVGIEREIFARSWQLAGHVGLLQQSGDYFTARIGNEPLLFVNDNGTLRGFFNVCRHRAGPIAYGCGSAKRLVCRYHGWAYDLSGQLLRATEMDGVALDVSSIHLESVAVHQCGPLLFVALEPTVPDFENCFPGVTAHCESLGLQHMRHVTRRNYPVQSNWKVYVDNYLEGYHIPLVHPSLNREIDYRRYVTELRARHVLQYAPVRETGATHYRSTSGDGQAWYYWLFPNVMLNIYENQLQTNIVVPTGADSCAVQFDWYSPEPVPDPNTDARWNELAAFSEEIQAEDAGICGAVQINIGSRAYRPGPYSLSRESGVRLFHDLMKCRIDEVMQHQATKT